MSTGRGYNPNPTKVLQDLSPPPHGEGEPFFVCLFFAEELGKGLEPSQTFLSQSWMPARLYSAMMTEAISREAETAQHDFWGLFLPSFPHLTDMALDMSVSPLDCSFLICKVRQLAGTLRAVSAFPKAELEIPSLSIFIPSFFLIKTHGRSVL